MASDATITKPADILASLHEIGDYRETMTRRAAGVIWIIWGMAFAGIGLFSLAFFLGSPESGWADITSIVVFGAAAALATNAVWRSHALERDPQHPAWVAWAAGIGVPLALGSAVWLSNQLFAFDEPAFMLSPLLLLGAAGALTITLLQRYHVPVLGGAIAAGALVVLFIIARATTIARTEFLDTAGNAILALVNLVAFTVVGLLHIRRG